MVFLKQNCECQNHEVMMGVFNKFEAIYRLYHILKFGVTVYQVEVLCAASLNLTVCNSINWRISLLDM